MMIINSVKMFLLFFVVVVVVYFVSLFVCCFFFGFVLFFQVNALQDARFSARGKI